MENQITIYTDGSYDPKKERGGWAAILFIHDEKISLQGKVDYSTHNRMEITAVLEALEYIRKKNLKPEKVWVYTDSQYITHLPERKEKLINHAFKTKKGENIRNSDLLRALFSFLDLWDIRLIKVKAHQKKTAEENYNREVDKLSRKIVRKGLG